MTEHEFVRLYESLIDRGDLSAALNVCDEFIVSHPQAVIGFWKKATLYARQKKFHEAVKSINEAVRLEPDNAGYYFFRGWWNFESGNFTGAETDQSFAIKLEKEMDSAMLIESAYFFRALARIRLNHFEDALSDSHEVSDDFLFDLESEGKVTIKDIREYAEARIK